MMDTLVGYGHQSESDAFVSVHDAAKAANVSARTVRRWITAGDVRTEGGPEGRRVSLPDVRRRVARGPARSQPTPAPTPSEEDMDNGVVAVAVATTLISHLTPHLADITDQVERLTREVMAEKIRADAAERERDHLRAELEQVSQELLTALTAVHNATGSGHRDRSVPAEATEIDEEELDTGSELENTESYSWWRRWLGLGPGSAPPLPRF